MTQFVLGLLLIAFAAVVGFYGTQLAREGWAKISSPPAAGIGNLATRPYVFFASTQLVMPSDRNKPIQVTFDLKNSGQSEAVGSCRARGVASLPLTFAKVPMRESVNVTVKDLTLKPPSNLLLTFPVSENEPADVGSQGDADSRSGISSASRLDLVGTEMKNHKPSVGDLQGCL